MFESDNTSVRFGTANTSIRYFRSDADGVANKNGVRKSRLIESEVAECGAEGRIRDRQTDDETQRENAVNQNPAVYRFGGEFCVEMKRLWILRQRGEQ